MSTTYKGQAANVTIPAPLAIVSSTDATPIVVTTLAHGLTSGDTVDIFGHAVNVAANGIGVVDVITGTTFALRGSAGSGAGAGGATGTVQPRTFVTTVQQPSDGDAAAAASIDTPMQAAADREAALLVMTGSGALVDVLTSAHDVTGSANWDSVTISSLSTWLNLTGATVWAPTRSIASGTNAVNAGDVLVIDASSSFVLGSLAIWEGQLALWVSITPPGGADTWVQLPGSGRFVDLIASGSLYGTLHFAGAAVAPRAGQLKIKLMAYGFSGTDLTTGFQFAGGYSIRALQLRPTGAGQ
jgi:hypothetical protein